MTGEELNDLRRTYRGAVMEARDLAKSARTEIRRGKPFNALGMMQRASEFKGFADGISYAIEHIGGAKLSAADEKRWKAAWDNIEPLQADLAAALDYAE